MSNVTEFNEEDLVWWAGEVFFIYNINNDDTVNLRHIKNKHNSPIKISIKNITKLDKIKTLNDWRSMKACNTLQSLIES